METILEHNSTGFFQFNGNNFGKIGNEKKKWFTSLLVVQISKIKLFV